MLAFLDPWCRVQPKTWRSCYYSLASKPMCIESHRIWCNLPILSNRGIYPLIQCSYHEQTLQFNCNKNIDVDFSFSFFFLVIIVQKHGLQYTQRWTHWGSPTSFGWACGEDTKHVGITICSSVWGKIDKVVELCRFFYTQILIILKIWNHATMSICLWGILKHYKSSFRY